MPLMRLLNGEGPSLQAADEIASSPGLHAEAVALIPALEAYVRPAGQRAVKAVLGKLLAVFTPPDRSEAEWAAWWEAYFEDLESFPLFALEQAAKDYRRQPGAEFFPKPGMMRDLANKAAMKATTALVRARLVANRPVKPVIEKPDPETRHQLAETLRNALKEIPK